MIWNVYAENKELKAKLDVANLEIKKRRADEDNKMHDSGQDYRNAQSRQKMIVERMQDERTALQDRIAQLEKALDLKSTLALTAQIRIDQLERAASGDGA